MFQSMPDRAKTSPLPVREAQGQPLVLVVEDEAALVTLLRYNLEREGFRVIDAANGEEALLIVKEQRPDLILLDWMLPALSGIEVCRQIRRSPEHRRTPIIMLTARGEESDKLRGLEVGADDYVTKPFEMAELLARVEAKLRRAVVPAQPAQGYQFGDVSVDFRRAEVTRHAEPVELSAREFQLLKYFIEHRGATLTREELLNEVWGYNAMPSTRTVDVHVAWLRQKIEPNPRHPQYVLTVHGMGYKFAG